MSFSEAKWPETQLYRNLYFIRMSPHLTQNFVSIV